MVYKCCPYYDRLSAIMGTSGGAPQHEITDNTAGADDADTDVLAITARLRDPTRRPLQVTDGNDLHETQVTETLGTPLSTPQSASQNVRNSEPSESFKSDVFDPVAEVRPFSAAAISPLQRQLVLLQRAFQRLERLVHWHRGS